MVPVSAGPSVASVRAGLVSATTGDAPVHVIAFRAWILGEHVGLRNLMASAVAGLEAPAGRSHRHVAILGYGAHAGLLDAGAGGALHAGLEWLSGVRWNQPFRPMTLEADGVSMLGVALAVRSVGGQDGFAPYAALASKAAGMVQMQGFARSLMVAASHVLMGEGRPDPSLMLPEAHVALAELGLLPRPDGRGSEAWENAVRLLPTEREVAQAALTLRAFDAMCASSLTARVGRLEPDDVVRVLGGMNGAMRNWTWETQARTKTSSIVRWEVQNEYHVQNLLWTVLSPLFADLCAEEYVAAVGQKNPRIDLGIPSLGLVVEVKFVRPGVAFAKTIEEIAADSALYGTDGRWKVLVPFVWDDSRRVEEHPKLIEGLRRLPMVHDAVVISRPGKMVSVGVNRQGGARLAGEP